jgi:hypothetical protein
MSLLLLLLYQVVDKMQSGGAKNNRRAELPTIGLAEQVIEELETLKAKDVDWQGKCSGTVYVHLIPTDNKLKLVHPITFQFIRLLFGQYVVNYSFFSSNKFYWLTFLADILLEVSLRVIFN